MRKISWLLILGGICLLFMVFGPVIKEEIIYNFTKISGVKYSVDTIGQTTFQRKLEPVNTDFSIVIPKIEAVAPIIDNVDPLNSSIYIKALKSGVAHASGTAYPGEIGNVYLFAHSTDAFYNVNKYNAVFFLIGHLGSGDEINVYFKGWRYKYVVYDKKVVESSDIKYLGTLEKGEKTLTLQTCYPPGTTIKRLVVLAKLEESSK